MFQHRFSKRRSQTPDIPAAAQVELLEDKRLLTSVVGDADKVLDPSINREPEHFFLQQTVPTGGHSLTFEEIRIVGDELWVLSEFQQPTGAATTVISTVGDGVTVNVPDLPIRHFRIGGGAGLPADTEVSAVTSRESFYELVGDAETELLYSRPDPELAAWREQIHTQIIDQADELYGDQFGQPTETPVQYFRGLPFIDAVPVAFAEAVSDTNVQVDGVDEGDIVETDGEFIYTISGKEVVIVRAATEAAAAEVVSRVELAETPKAMFLHNDRLTVISQESGYVGLFSRLSSVAQTVNVTVVTVLDVSDKQTPTLIQETMVDGRFQSSRAVGDQVYVVVNNNSGIPYVPELFTIYDSAAEPQFRFETRDEYLARVDEFVNGGANGGGLTPPSVYRRSDEGPEQQSLERLGWLNGVGDPAPGAGQLTSVLQFDVSQATSAPVSNIGVQTRQYSQTEIYASQEALYLVTEEYVLEYEDSAGDDFFVAQPSAVQSRIHKIGLSADGLVLEGEGVVPGNVESQFSIDEHDGYLRIVTTTGRNWWWTNQESQNHLFVLQDTGDELVEVGSVRDLAAGERIYSARFDGDRAWMVTFRQVDPVFSFDLSDPTNPHVTGELKIPGYSDHLQLIDENHLLAIGRNATEEGRIEEVQVSLFDVSDMADPTLLHRYSMDSDVWGYSDALQDHLAFNYLAESQILAVPFGAWAQQGMVLLHVDVTDGFELVGQIDAEPQIGLAFTEFGWNQENSYKRSVQIDDLLYAVSSASIAVVNLNDPGTVLQTMKLQEEQAPHYPVPDLPPAPVILERVVDLVETIREDGTADEVRFSLNNFLTQPLPILDEIEEFEFRVLDRQTGEELVREVTESAELVLSDAAGELIEPGTYDVQFRTKLNRLLNPQFGAWSAPETLSVLSEQASMISDNVLEFGERLLKWSKISDRIFPPELGTNGGVNPVDRYEVWINDATDNQLVLLDRNVDIEQLNVDLAAGEYFAWFRAVYEDGTRGDWSIRERFQILGEQLRGLVGPGVTANFNPEIRWGSVTDAVGFEVEVTSPDGATTVYDIQNVTDLRMKFEESLASGTYQFRVRARLPNGAQSEWSELHDFTIAARPVVERSGERLQLISEFAEQVEIWVSSATTNELLLHDFDWQDTTIEDAIDTLGLRDEAAGQYNIWIRSLLADGTQTAWSPKTSLYHDVADVVDVLPVADIRLGGDQTLTWQAAEGVASYEVYVRRDGDVGATYYQSGIDGLQHSIPQQLEAGRHLLWVRGILAGGGFTEWGNIHYFNVTDQPVVNIVDGLASWVGTADGAQHEVWINRVDESFGLLEARVVHILDYAESSFDLNTLPEGNYSFWIRKIGNNGDDIVRSAWSQRENLSVTRIEAIIDDVGDTIDDVLDDVLESLDLF